MSSLIFKHHVLNCSNKQHPLICSTLLTIDQIKAATHFFIGGNCISLSSILIVEFRNTMKCLEILFSMHINGLRSKYNLLYREQSILEEQNTLHSNGNSCQNKTCQQFQGKKFVKSKGRTFSISQPSFLCLYKLHINPSSSLQENT